MNFKVLLMVLLATGLVSTMGCSKKAASPAGPVKVSQARYHCPMHPQIVSEKPGECPICGMDLVPIEEAAGQEGKSGVSGLAPVTLSTEARQRMGLKLGAIEKREMLRILRLPARIVPDETRQIRVTTKIEGYYEVLSGAAAGDQVVTSANFLVDSESSIRAAMESHSGDKMP